MLLITTCSIYWIHTNLHFSGYAVLIKIQFSATFSVINGYWYTNPHRFKTGASKLIKTMSNDLRTCFAVQTVNLVARFKFSEMIRFDSCSFLYLIISLVHLSSRQINILPVHSYKRNILWINLFIEVDCDI